MKIQNINTTIINNYKYKNNTIPKKQNLQYRGNELLKYSDYLYLRNKVSFSSNNIENNIIAKEVCKNDQCTLIDFYDGEKLIGKAHLSSINQGKYGDFPESWYIEKQENIDGILKTKPICKVVTFVMEDKIGISEYKNRANGKKYGTMCMQKSLEWANNNGYDDRITLNPSPLDSFVSPAQFYAKLGFELSPRKNAIRKQQIEELSQRTDAYSKQKLFYALKNIECGRFLAFPGDNVNLVHPEILRDYLIHK